jgi:hypothetical protein
MDNHEHERHILIHIDQRPYESSNPTAGEALYKLGQCRRASSFFVKFKGGMEDPEVPDSKETVHLRADEDFHRAAPGSQHHVHHNLPSRPACQSPGNVDRGRRRQGQGRDERCA